MCSEGKIPAGHTASHIHASFSNAALGKSMRPLLTPPPPILRYIRAQGVPWLTRCGRLSWGEGLQAPAARGPLSQLLLHSTQICFLQGLGNRGEADSKARCLLRQ